MKQPTMTPADPVVAAEVLRDAQASAWHEIKLAMTRQAADPLGPSVDDLDLLRAALAEYVMAERMLAAARPKGN